MSHSRAGSLNWPLRPAALSGLNAAWFTVHPCRRGGLSGWPVLASHTRAAGQSSRDHPSSVAAKLRMQHCLFVPHWRGERLAVAASHTRAVRSPLAVKTRRPRH